MIGTGVRCGSRRDRVGHLISNRVAIPVTGAGQCQGHCTGGDLRCRRRVSGVQRGVVRREGAASPAPDPACCSCDRTVQCDRRCIGANRSIGTGVHDRRRSEGDHLLIAHGVAGAVTGGGERKGERTSREFRRCWRVSRVQRSIVRQEGSRSTGPNTTRCQCNRSAQCDLGIIRAKRNVSPCIRSWRRREADRHLIGNGHAVVVASGGERERHRSVGDLRCSGRIGRAHVRGARIE